MKIRIKGNSVRYRLTQSEVKILSEKGRIYECTDFGVTKLNYGIVLKDTSSNLSITFENNCITLYMPLKNGVSWVNNTIITYEHTLKSKEGNLHLLLEKDFTCLDNTLEDQSDNYPNPKLNI